MPLNFFHKLYHRIHCWWIQQWVSFPCSYFRMREKHCLTPMKVSRIRATKSYFVSLCDNYCHFTNNQWSNTREIIFSYSLSRFIFLFNTTFHTILKYHSFYVLNRNVVNAQSCICITLSPMQYQNQSFSSLGLRKIKGHQIVIFEYISKLLTLLMSDFFFYDI